MADNAASAINQLVNKVSSALPTPGQKPEEAPAESTSTPVQTQTATATASASKDGAPAVEQEDATASKDINPAVEWETVKKEHETQEQKVVDKERHQDHYATKIQPLTDREVLDTEHKQETAPTEHREVKHEGGEDVEANVAARESGFKNETTQGETVETTTAAPTKETEQVHHHLHQTVQPVIEKETVQPSVTHKTIPVKEVHQEAAKDHGVEIANPISKEEFEGRLDGEQVTKDKLVDDASPGVSKKTI